jgi:hypothetical protein
VLDGVLKRHILRMRLHVKPLLSGGKHLLLCYISTEGIGVFELVSRLDLQAAILCGLALWQRMYCVTMT